MGQPFGPERRGHPPLTIGGFDPVSERGVEALLAVGNGHVGTRAALEEGGPASLPLTLVAGAYDPLSPNEEPPPDPDSAPSPIAVADWASLRLWLDDEELRLDHGTALLHQRTADCRAGSTIRRWDHRLPSGLVVRATFTRWSSLADRHALVQELTVLLPEEGAAVRLAASLSCVSLERDVAPYLRRPVLEPPAPTLPATIVLRGAKSGVRVALAQSCGLSRGDASTSMVDRKQTTLGRSRDGVTEWWEWHAEGGVRYRWHRVVALHSSLEADVAQPGEAAVTHVGRLQRSGPEAVIAEHRRQWEQQWRAGAVELEGDEETRAGLQAATRHLTMAANPEDDRVSVGGRALTGENYRGHVLWDTEVYLLPYYTLAWPEAARAMLGYRYRALPRARARARRFGFEGALYPWEAAGASEATPAIDRDPSGKETEIRTWRRAHHISAAVPYATWQYWQATGDDQFFADAGAEMMVECARFWASRVERGDDGRGHVTGVMGPDEYHEHVDDSAYTNWMAAHTMELGRRTAAWLRDERPDAWERLRTGLGLDQSEIDGWVSEADRLVRGQDGASGLIEQFAGYFDLEDRDIGDHTDRGKSMHSVLGREGVAKTQITKQADVVLLCHLLADQLSAEAIASNFDYYEPRCDHASSLSMSIHALVAARMGRGDQALELLHQAASKDLGDNVGSAAHGVHIANFGGVWQAVVLGAAGLKVTRQAVSFQPRLLPGWDRLRIPFRWQRRSLVAEVRSVGADVEVEVRSRHGGGEGEGVLACQVLCPGERLTVEAQA